MRLNKELEETRRNTKLADLFEMKEDQLNQLNLLDIKDYIGYLINNNKISLQKYKDWTVQQFMIDGI